MSDADDTATTPLLSIPAQGRDASEVLEAMRARAVDDADWRSGRTFSLVYHLSDEHSAFLKDAYTTFFSENALNPVAFGSLRTMEAEVVRMAASLLNGDADVAGTMTSGGSESIMVAVKTYRDWARSVKAIPNPELVLPISAHPAFVKACHYLDVVPVHVPVQEDGRVLAADMEAAITPRTAAIVGSAPGYPHGVIDPIEELGAIAQAHTVGFHVDACLGGFMLPWVERLRAEDPDGPQIPPFDFRVDGVSSMSADVHKYGFAAKGASVVLYRDADLRRHQFHAMTSWPGGIYISPTAAGTRPGGAIAAAWAALNAIGQDGYLETFRGILDTADRMRAGVDAVDGLRVIGEPAGTVFAFTSDEVDVYAVGDQLDERGWTTDRQIKPAALHCMITPVHAPVVDDFLADLATAVETVRANPELSTQGQAAMYGMMASIPDGEEDAITDFVLTLLDGFYEV